MAETKGVIDVDETTYLFVTIGNYTFVTFSRNHTTVVSKEGGRPILKLLDAFEKKYPELEVTSWNLETQKDWIDGVWINHRPKVRS